MGDPRKKRKKWQGPMHPWEGARIKEENKIVEEYGLKNKREIWKSQSLLRRWQNLAKGIVGLTGEKGEKAERILLAKLQKLGIVRDGGNVDDVLSSQLRNVLEHRLQTKLYKSGIAHTPKQARQFIVHNKVLVNGEKVNSPSYFVKAADQVKLVEGFNPHAAEVKAELKASREQPAGERK